MKRNQAMGMLLAVALLFIGCKQQVTSPKNIAQSTQNIKNDNASGYANQKKEASQKDSSSNKSITDAKKGNLFSVTYKNEKKDYKSTDWKNVLLLIMKFALLLAFV